MCPSTGLLLTGNLTPALTASRVFTQARWHCGEKVKGYCESRVLANSQVAQADVGAQEKQSLVLAQSPLLGQDVLP